MEAGVALLLVLSSRATQARAVVAHATWCRARGVVCRFVADQPFRGRRPPTLAWTVLHSASPHPSSCCRKGKGFFCSPHRQRTLRAQYRYLPALHRAGVTQLRAQPHLHWIVVLDDDSFVFPTNLVQLLRRYNHRDRLLLGELKPSGEYACGGAGTVLSRAAALRLNVPSCIARFQRRCMQSDWMLAECARSSGIRLDGSHGCSSCAVEGSAAADDVLARSLKAGCQFMQNAGRHLSQIPTNFSSPSIVHGYTQNVELVSAVLAQRMRNASSLGQPQQEVRQEHIEENRTARLYI
ncbi:hypothetical protein AB1Y20_005796 [Prymnesium parvum]|uniref:Fringe-like glycosyltransferase domain-containing protein n=1 Tax=Prymnesium parvum TaxID=97485 RepID=A0AB34J205_PRYPA